MTSSLSALWIFAFAFLSFAAGWAATRWVRAFVLRKNIFDIPNERSSHTVPTARGGGLAIVAILAVISLLATLAGFLPKAWWYALGPALVVSAAGWWDDIKGLSAAKRLRVQMSMAAVGVILLEIAKVVAPDRALDTGLFLVPPGFATFTVVVLFVVWMTNLYNFMDGIDGILGLQGLTASLAAGDFCYLSGELELALFYAITIGTLAGFLVLNWSPSKIFSGDVGSAFLGFFLAFLAIIGASRGSLSWPAAIVLHFAFIGDATYTLFVRLARKKKPHQAHRSHFYQKMVQRGFSHSRVSLLFGALNLFWLLPIAYGVEMSWVAPWGAYLLAALPVFGLGVYFRAGVD